MSTRNIPFLYRRSKRFPNGSFTMANLNSFLSPKGILSIAQENIYLRNFFYFIMTLYVVCTH